MDCDKSFLGFPTWHNGLSKVVGDPPECVVEIADLDQIWVIVGNIATILLQLGIYIAIGFVIYGGVQFVISQGSPDKIAAAKGTIQNAVIGLVIAVSASLVVRFILGTFSPAP